MMRKICYTAGVWDLLHRGHLNILRKSRMLVEPYGILVVGVVTDRGAEAYKRRPVRDEETRAELIREMRSVDMVVMQDGTDPTEALERLTARGHKPDVFTHGDDWTRLKEGHDTLRKLGIEFKLIPYTHGVSTTETIRLMTA